MKKFYSLLLTFLLANPVKAADNGQQGSSWKIWTGFGLTALGLGYGAYKYTNLKPATQKSQKPEKITFNTPAPDTLLLRTFREFTGLTAFGSIALTMSSMGGEDPNPLASLGFGGVALTSSFLWLKLHNNYSEKLRQFRYDNKEDLKVLMQAKLNSMVEQHEAAKKEVDAKYVPLVQDLIYKAAEYGITINLPCGVAASFYFP